MNYSWMLASVQAVYVQHRIRSRTYWMRVIVLGDLELARCIQRERLAGEVCFLEPYCEVRKSFSVA